MVRKTPRPALAAGRTALPLAQPLDEPEAQPPVGIRVADEVEEHGVGFRRFQRSNERIGAFFDHDMHLKILDVKTIVRLRWRHAGNDKPAVDPEPAEFSGEDKRVVANPIDPRRQGGNDVGDAPPQSCTWLPGDLVMREQRNFPSLLVNPKRGFYPV